MTDIKFLIASHKNWVFPKGEMFLPIQVGKKDAEIKLDIQGDDDGDHISEKNPNYCELTAYYWAWKNLDADIIGLFHYRRYFNLSSYAFSKKVKTIKQNELDDYLPKLDRISKLLKKHDIIMTKPYVIPHSMYVYYSSCHVKEDLDIITDILKIKHPDYISTWMNFLYGRNKYSPYNMLICKKEIFDKYCEWLFPVLFEVEKRIKMSPHPYQQRVYGFMAERLLNVFCFHNKLRIKSYPILLIDDSEESEKSKIKEYLDVILSFINDRFLNLSFFIGNQKRIIRKDK